MLILLRVGGDNDILKADWETGVHAGLWGVVIVVGQLQIALGFVKTFIHCCFVLP